MKKIQLIIERGADKRFWGRILIEDNLIVDAAETVGELDLKMKALLNQFHDMNIEQLDHAYDISAFFDNFNFLNQSKIAQLTNINASLLRQYSSGNKFPSFKQTQKIEHAIHQLAKELSMVTLISG